MKKIFLLLFLLPACSYLSAPWTQDRIEKLREEFCVNEMGEQPYSGSCDCFVAATLENFDNFTAYARSNKPTQKYKDDLLWCGYVIK